MAENRDYKRFKPKGYKTTEAEKNLSKSRVLRNVGPKTYLSARLADRVDSGVAQRDAIRKASGNNCENAFTLSNWTPTYDLNRNSYSMDDLANLVMTGFSEGCLKSASPVSAGLVQGLNYDYVCYLKGSDTAITQVVSTAVDTTNLRLSLDCDGTHPVLVLINADMESDTTAGRFGLLDLHVNGVGTGALTNQTNATSTYGRIYSIESDGGVADRLCMAAYYVIHQDDLVRGTNTIDLAAWKDTGTWYLKGTTTATQMFAVELKTVEGQITQAKVDNRTQHIITRITDWDNRPTNPTDGEVIVFNVNGDHSWQMQYDEADNRWEYIGGGHWTQYVYATISTTSTTPVTLTGETISFPNLPAGNYAVHHGHLSTCNAAYVWQVGTVNGGAPEAPHQNDTANVYDMCSVGGDITLASTTTVGPTYSTASGTSWFGRRWMTIVPNHLDN